MPWTWLRRFGQFLLLWPVFCFAGIGELYDSLDEVQWDVVAGAAFVPAAIGMVLLGVARLLTRSLGASVAALGQPVPNLLRDLSNVCIVGAFLLVPVIFLDWLDGTPPSPQGLALLQLGVGLALILRATSRLIYGPSRHDTLGVDWAPPPVLLRYLGYLTLVCILLPLFVMFFSISIGEPNVTHGELVALLLVQLIGQRSAMVRPVGVWARTPWEAALRQYSLYGPWAVAVVVVFFGGSLLLLGGVVLYPHEIPLVGLAILVPTALFGVVGSVIFLRPRLPPLVGNLISFWQLHRRVGDIKGWTLVETPGGDPKAVIRLAGQVESEVWVSNPSNPVKTYLQSHWPR